MGTSERADPHGPLPPTTGSPLPTAAVAHAGDFQPDAFALPGRFPSLEARAQRPTNLPVVLSTFVGRGRELSDLSHLLRAEQLVTLTGLGGSGKTRLTLQAAAAGLDGFDDGVCFVDLAPVNDPDVVAASIARALNLPQIDGQPVEASLVTSLRERRLLLVLDNFEHLISAAPLVARLLVACPGLAVLITSRAPLRLTGEREYAVPPLPLDADTGEAVELFVQRASAVRPDLICTPEDHAAIAAICARLDSLSLAIELAAARCRLFTPPALLARLDRALPLLTEGPRDAPARQRSLRETVAWSYALLSAEEQAVFRQLAVFAGGWTLDAAGEVCVRSDGRAIDVLETVGSLIEKHLVRRLDDADNVPRFGMLETIREFAYEQLTACGGLPAVQQRHADLFLRLAESEASRLGQIERMTAVRRLEREYDNLRAALTFCRDRTDRPDLFARLAAALIIFWHQGISWTEGRIWLEQAAAITGDISAGLRARVLDGVGMLALEQRDFTVARARFMEPRHSPPARRAYCPRPGTAVPAASQVVRAGAVPPRAPPAPVRPRPPAAGYRSRSAPGMLPSWRMAYPSSSSLTGGVHAGRVRRRHPRRPQHFHTF